MHGTTFRRGVLDWLLSLTMALCAPYQLPREAAAAVDGRMGCGIAQRDRRVVFPEKVRRRVVLCAYNCMGIVALARHLGLPTPSHMRLPDFLRVRRSLKSLACCV
jgi:hypothetical protein